MVVKAVILEPGDDRWKRVLSKVRHQFYQCPEYVALEASRQGGEARAVFVEGEGGALLVPLVFHAARVGESGPEVLDAISPYGYPGMLVDARGSGEPFVRDALETARPVLARAGVTGVFVRLDPLLDRPEYLAGIGTLVRHGACTWIDLTLTREELHRHLRGRYRSYIRALERAGVRARFDEAFTNLDVFIELYYRTMDAVGAARLYYFEHSYFDGLRAILGDALKLCLVEHLDRIVAAGLFAVSGGVVQYLFSGKDEAGGHPHATKLMMVHVRDWAKAEGNQVMHLGGGVGGRTDDALSRFKRGFSKLTRPFFTWRWIVHEERFSEAVTAWEHFSGQEADHMAGYFPPYRKPIDRGSLAGSPVRPGGHG